MRDDSGYEIHHRVRLPGGRQIEVVYLDSRRNPGDAGTVPASEAAPVSESAHGGSTSTPSRAGGSSQPPATQSETRVALTPSIDNAPSSAPGEALHVCPRCAGGLVHPLDWAEESTGRWRILMRCPDCGLLREGVFGEALVERLDEELDRAAGALLGDLDRITRSNMASELQLFVRALALDLIDPSDFER